MAATPDSTFKRRDGVVSQVASKKLVLLDVDGGEYYSLNDVGARVWELSDGSHSLEQIINTLIEEHDAPGDVIRADVTELVEDLVVEKLLVKVS